MIFNNFVQRKETYRSGAKRTFKVPAIAAGEVKQYSFEDNSIGIGYLVEKYGYLNFVTCINSDVVDVEISLDYLPGKTYPTPKGSSISVDELQFREFNIKNLDDTSATNVGKITVVVGYEPPLEREREHIEQMFAKKGWLVK
jgi:hypothetical protein